MFQTELVENNLNTFFIFSNFFTKIFSFMTKCGNIVEPGRPQMTIWCMRIACWITTFTNTYSEYVMLVGF